MSDKTVRDELASLTVTSGGTSDFAMTATSGVGAAAGVSTTYSLALGN